MKEDPIFRIFLRAKLQRARTIKITSLPYCIRRVLQGTEATSAHKKFLLRTRKLLKILILLLSFDVFSRACCLTMMQSIIDMKESILKEFRNKHLDTHSCAVLYLFSRHDTQLASLDGYVTTTSTSQISGAYCAVSCQLC